jgi:hypothetical protein
MNRLSALEANTTLYARYVEEQTNAMREMLRRLNEDMGRLEGIGRAQAQMYARTISDFEKHRREMDVEQRTLISQVNYLAEEVSPPDSFKSRWTLALTTHEIRSSWRNVLA